MAEPFFHAATLKEHADALAAVCPVMATARSAPIRPWRKRPASFAGLARAIAYQQLAGAAALAIWSRVEAKVAPMTPKAFLAVAEDALRAAGLSRPKIAHIRAIAEAAVDKRLDFKALAVLPEEEARAMLTAVRGVGPWTADVFLMSAYGRIDIFPAGDLGLQMGYQRAAGLAERPTPKVLAAKAAEAWAPRRSVAALMLWAYVDDLKARARKGAA